MLSTIVFAEPTDGKRWKKSRASAQTVPIFPEYWKRLVTKKKYRRSVVFGSDSREGEADVP
jgi:hypothetical protein